MDALNPPSLFESIPQAAEAIRNAQSIVCACHVNPDGDALGSMLGLALGLAPLGQQITTLSQDGIPEILRFLPERERIQTTTDIPAFDLAIVLDSGDLSRVGQHVLPIIQRAQRVIDIDHHVIAGAFGDIRVLNAKAASTSEIVYSLLKALNLPITEQVATCLFTGIITDTGSFRFQNVTPNTFQIAADLLTAGAPPAYISENVFDNRTFAATKLLGIALSSLKQAAEGRIVWARISAADFAMNGATDEETEGVVNYARGARGAQMGILFREIAPNNVRVSLRSQEGIDVAEIASRFGGGGHRMASGCTLNVSLDAAEQMVIGAALDSLSPQNYA